MAVISRAFAADEYTYDADGRVTAYNDGLGYESMYTYDGVGNKLTTTDQNGNTTMLCRKPSSDSAGLIDQALKTLRNKGFSPACIIQTAEDDQDFYRATQRPLSTTR